MTGNINISKNQKDALFVSRETMDRLELYQALLQKWQKQINLVGPGTLSVAWERHFLDSTQLLKHISRHADLTGPLFDLGSGAGFPGLVLAIMGRTAVTLIESNGKKCTFMREVARRTETEIEIINSRIEDYRPPEPAQIITSRALAPLDKLLSLAQPLLRKTGICLFLKGEKHEEELTLAQKHWNMSVTIHPSETDAAGVILEIGGISPVPD